MDSLNQLLSYLVPLIGGLVGVVTLIVKMLDAKDKRFTALRAAELSSKLSPQQANELKTRLDSIPPLVLPLVLALASVLASLGVAGYWHVTEQGLTASDSAIKKCDPPCPDGQRCVRGICQAAVRKPHALAGEVGPLSAFRCGSGDDGSDRCGG